MHLAEWEATAWFRYLEKTQQELVVLSRDLLLREQATNTTFVDYGFVVFPMSRAYEGFLKQYFYDLALIDTVAFEGRQFRIGRALNPDIRRSQRDEFWLYDDLEHMCGKDLARELWETWLECRNRVFHFFPTGEQPVTLERAEHMLTRLSTALSAAVACHDTANTVKRIRKTLQHSTQVI